MAHTHKFDPAHLDRLLSSQRREWQDPESILAALGLQTGERLADVGVGPGYFALAAARMVGPEGTVYGFDIEPRMLTRLEEEARSAGLTQIQPVHSGESRLPLEDGAVNAVLMANVFHELHDPAEMMREIRRILSPGGRLLIVDWKKEETPMGPPLHERRSPEEVTETVVPIGFSPQGLREGGPNHYGVLFQRT